MNTAGLRLESSTLKEDAMLSELTYLKKKNLKSTMLLSLDLSLRILHSRRIVGERLTITMSDLLRTQDVHIH